MNPSLNVIFKQNRFVDGQVNALTVVEQFLKLEISDARLSRISDLKKEMSYGKGCCLISHKLNLPFDELLFK